MLFARLAAWALSASHTSEIDAELRLLHRLSRDGGHNNGKPRDHGRSSGERVSHFFVNVSALNDGLMR